MSTEAQLCDELAAWQKRHGLPPECAFEQMARPGVTREQFKWLSDFCDRWDLCMRAEPALPMFNDPPTCDTQLQRQLDRLGLAVWETGGGCTALGLRLGTDGAHVLVTEAGDCEAPCLSTVGCSDPVTVGVYHDDGDSDLYRFAEIPASTLPQLLTCIVTAYNIGKGRK